MTVEEMLDAEALARAIGVYSVALRAHRDAINRLNVYPVPDGDTGTNMGLTVEAVLRELETSGAGRPGADDLAAAGMEATCKAISHGSLMGARGNSGVILSQILRGLCEVIGGFDQVDPATFARALSAASDAARDAVMKPVEGTILTVVREAANGASAAADRGMSAMLETTRQRAAEALERTPELLPVLMEAGVVDAGGAGLLLLFDALLNVVDGRPMPEIEVLSPADAPSTMFGHSFDAVSGEHTMADLRYEVMFFLEAPDDTIPAFKDLWAGIGDSIVVVGGNGIWNCHIHTDDIGASIETALDCGRPRRVRVTDLFEQVEEERWVREGVMQPAEPAHASEPVTCAVVAVATGAGVSRIFYSLGVQKIVRGGQTMNPSTAQLLEASQAAPAEEVVILPNNKNIIPVAEQIDTQTTKTVRVVPTRGIAEGFASLLSYDPQASSADNAKAMAEAAEGVVSGEVTMAVRDSVCGLGPIEQGDWIGLCREGIKAVSSSLAEACVQLLDSLIRDDHELVTIIEGEGATPAATRGVELWLQERHPGLGPEIHHGGQPLYPYVFGIE